MDSLARLNETIIVERFVIEEKQDNVGVLTIEGIVLEGVGVEGVEALAVLLLVVDHNIELVRFDLALQSFPISLILNLDCC